MKTPRNRRILPLIALVAIAGLSPAAHADRQERNEIRKKIESYQRALRDKRAELDEATGNARQAEADARGAKERETAAAAALAQATEESSAARQAAGDANRAAVEHDKRSRERVDALPDVVAAAEHFAKVDKARETISESVLTPVRASDEYKGKQKELADVERERSNYLAVSNGNTDPQRLQLFIATQQSLEAEIKQMELTAIGNSPQASAARKAAEEASAKLTTLRDQHMRSMRSGAEAQNVASTLAESRKIVGEKNKAIAVAKRDLAAAKSETRTALRKHAFYTNEVKKKQRDVDGLEDSIRNLRRKYDKA